MDVGQVSARQTGTEQRDVGENSSGTSAGTGNGDDDGQQRSTGPGIE